MEHSVVDIIRAIRKEAFYFKFLLKRESRKVALVPDTTTSFNFLFHLKLWAYFDRVQTVFDP